MCKKLTLCNSAGVADLGGHDNEDHHLGGHDAVEKEVCRTVAEG